MRDVMNLLVVCLTTIALVGCSLIVADKNVYGFPDGGVDADRDAGRQPDSGQRDAGESDAGPCGACPTDTPYCDASSGACRQCLESLQCDDGVQCTVDRCDLSGTCTSVVDVACIAAVGTGRQHSCALSASGSVWCWGDNGSGQLGNNAMGADSAFPVRVLDLTDAAQLGVGWMHSCALRATGQVVCWGLGTEGQLGDDNCTPVCAPAPRPVTVIGLTDAVEVSAGGHHTCARRQSGAVVCWGTSYSGELGSDVITSRTPLGVAGIDDAVEIDAGGSHTCARLSTGAVTCWGAAGLLGDGTMTDSVVPVIVEGLTDAVELSAGTNHTCARRAGGTIVCWGENSEGALGDDSTAPATRPATVLNIADATNVEAGDLFTCARLAGGTVSCWGFNFSGELGNGSSGGHELAPVAVLGLSNALWVSAGGDHACARRLDNTLACWGLNTSGQLGDGTMMERTTLVSVMGF